MVKNTTATNNKKSKSPAKSKPTKAPKPARTDIKSVTYEYDDGINCTVTTPAGSPNANSAFSLITSTAKNMNKSNTTSTSTINSAATEVTVSSTKPAAGQIRSYSDLRTGVKKKEAVEIMEKFNFPNRPFTIKEVLFSTGIDHWYVRSYIQANAKVVGNAPKQPGERGKVAKLYQITKA